MPPIDPKQLALELSRYQEAPLGVVRNGGAWPEPRFERSLIACARWEARYVAEWLLYHRSIGIDHVFLYGNDDDPGELWEAIAPFLVGPEPFVTFHHFPFQGAQFQMYFHALRNHAHETRWLMLLDLDEFICVRGSNQIGPLLDSVGADADAVYFNWCGFGANGHATRPHGSVLMNYTRRERTVTPFTKVFIRSRSVPFTAFFHRHDAPVMHDWRGIAPTLVTRTVLGEELGDYYREFPKHAWPFILTHGRSERTLATAFVAHYNIKSDADFELRVARGLAGDYGTEVEWGRKSADERARFHELTNAVEDTYLADYWRDYRSRAGWHDSALPRPEWPLIRPGGDALQSSTAHQRALTEDARALVSRRLTGKPQSHTLAETDPWWSIDLGGTYRVREVRLFNRLDGVIDRMARFVLEASLDGERWTTLHVKDDNRIYGGADGTPYRALIPEGVVARWIALRVPGADRYLHLDQIEMFGEPADGSVG